LQAVWEWSVRIDRKKSEAQDNFFMGIILVETLIWFAADVQNLLMEKRI